MQDRYPSRPVVLVSKDINMRIKARALGLHAEDYFNDHVLEDTDLLYAGVRQLPADFWDTHSKGVESWQQNGATWYRLSGPLVVELHRQRVRLSRGRRRVAVCAGQGSAGQDRGAEDAARLHAREEQRVGASPRATASRTSR